jgi:hypothetical protein
MMLPTFLGNSRHALRQLPTGSLVGKILGLSQSNVPSLAHPRAEYMAHTSQHKSQL